MTSYISDMTNATLAGTYEALTGEIERVRRMAGSVIPAVKAQVLINGLDAARSDVRRQMGKQGGF